MKQAEDMATKLLLPGAHSGGPGEEGEQLPPWVELFHRYFELKKNQLSKSASQDQVCFQIWTMQNTIDQFKCCSRWYLVIDTGININK